MLSAKAYVSGTQLTSGMSLFIAVFHGFHSYSTYSTYQAMKMQVFRKVEAALQIVDQSLFLNDSIFCYLTN